MITIKIGGAQGIDLPAVCRDVANVILKGEQVIFVHGGSNETNALCEALGVPTRFLTTVTGFTSRYTDRATLEIFNMATAKINLMLVEELQKAGVNALGLSGADGRLLRAKRNEAIKVVENGKRLIIRDDFTGKIEEVNTALLHSLLEAGFTPVIQPLAVSDAGEALNVDADRAAAMIAGAMGASELVLLTNVAGLMRHYPDESTVIPLIHRHEAQAALEAAEGRMKKKVLGAMEALERGVEKIIIADGRCAQPLQSALAGQGTIIQQ